MTVKRIILIRPGETDWNREGRYQGWVASPLNTHGRAQVQALAKYVRHIGLSALYTSDLRRAMQTAKILAKPLGFDPIMDERLRERHVGQWQGLTLEQIHEWYPDQYQALLANPENYRIPGGESRADVRGRVLKALEAILEEADGEIVGIITHTNATNMLIDNLVPEYELYTVGITNSSVTTIARENDGAAWRLVATNDVMHLEGLASNAFREMEDEGHD